MRHALLPGLLALALGAGAGAARATPITPRDDAQVIEVLGAAAPRAEERHLRRALADEPRQPALAAQLARRYLDEARAQGDPRLAGRALALLQPWPDPATAPLEVLLLQATLAQYLHEFDTAAALLERLLQRDPRQPQAWLTLATIRRVQGRYAASDAACERLAALRVAPHAQACVAENEALRGDFAGARARLDALLGAPRLDAGTRAWLLTTLAELETRVLRPAAAEAAFKASLAAESDVYTATAYADFLLAQGRAAEVRPLLEPYARSDAVLLRLALAGVRAPDALAARDAGEMRERIAQARERPQAAGVHAREQAMFALGVERDPARALALARENLRRQREPIDLLVLAEAARAAREPAAQREVERARQEMGLDDRRLDALL